MPYAIELYFDDKSTMEVEEIWSKLRERNISLDEGTNPHISLAIYEDIDVEYFKEKLQVFAKGMEPFDLKLASVEMFATDKPVVFLSPTVTEELLYLHEKFHKYFKEYDTVEWDYYKPGNWVPHCTLAMNLSKNMVQETLDVCQEISLPIDIKIKGIGILEFKPNKQLVKYMLGDNE